MHQLEIKIMQEHQHELMHEIARFCHTHPMSQQALASCFGQFYRVFGAFVNDHLCGYLILYQIFEDASLIDICVHPQSQGKGIAKALLNQAITWLKTTEAKELLLEVRQSNYVAKALYQNLGFSIYGSRKDYYQTDSGMEDACLMRLLLG